jgi:S1-C subfamily serine protease
MKHLFSLQSWPAGVTALVWAVLIAALIPTALASPLDAVVGVRAEIPSDAATAPVLGTEREGSGVVIDDSGLVLTIGYIILEAAKVEIELADTRVLPANVVAYDYDTGFGLLKPVIDTDLRPVSLGVSKDLSEDSQVLAVDFSGGATAHRAHVVSRRDFAGYWEYLLPDAIFTSPPIRNFAGAALFGPDGGLLGIGSLVVGDAAPDRNLPGNMFVPIDALKPILPDLLARGRASGPVRPWLGVYAGDLRGHVFVDRVAPEGPAAKAGMAEDDIILAVKGQAVTDLADFYRKLWAVGEAGIAVALTVIRGGRLVDIEVISADRYDHLKLQHDF